MISSESLSILKYLAKQIHSNRVIPERPDTYISYSEIHHKLNLVYLGPKYGESLLNQGLRELVEFLENNNHPRISSIIIDKATLMPGGNYFKFFGREYEDIQWWNQQVRKVLKFNWLKLIEKIEGVPVHGIVYPDVLNEQEVHNEGMKKKVLINYYERDSLGRRKCIEYYGCQCIVCKIMFESIYGDIGKHFIHVHHIIPLSSIDETYILDPVKDLRPVCPNCHAMLHKRVPPFSIDELSSKLK